MASRNWAIEGLAPRTGSRQACTTPTRLTSTLRRIVRWSIATRGLCFYELSLSSDQAWPVEPAAALGNDLSIEYPSVADLREYAEHRPEESFWRRLYRFSRDGATVVCVWAGAGLAYRGVAMTGPRDVFVNGYGVIEVPADVCYISHCETDPAYRGHGIYPRMLQTVAEHVLRGGRASRVLVATDVENIPSQRGIIKAGFHLSAIRIGCTLLGGRVATQLHSVEFAPGHFRS